MNTHVECACGLAHPSNSLMWNLSGHRHRETTDGSSFLMCPSCLHIVEHCTCSKPKPPTPSLPHAKATFDRAHSLIGGDRRDAYGDVQTSFDRVAKVWSGILGNRTVTAREVCLMMTGLKLCREANGTKADNVDDACGYLGLLAELNAADGLKASKEMKY